MLMRQKIKNILTAAVLLLVLLAASIPVPFTAKAGEGILEIRSKEDWISFAENCRIDSYSEGLQVFLKTDLDLTGESGITVPVFCGSFNGEGHSVTGIWLEASTDTMGLFRILTPDASVSSLTIYAGIRTEKERSVTGLLCGENQGQIENCVVFGSVKSYSDVGAVAGKNSGAIANCTSQAVTEGTLRTGGIAGLNEGTILGCTNMGDVNTGANEGAVSAGGIAGENAGQILSCGNQGKIGYLHTGYNVGGIAGYNRGYIEYCTNRQSVLGRRDVGGISGQMEPSFRLEYGKNAMRLLNNNVSGFSDSLNNAMAVIEDAVSNGAAGLNNVLWQIGDFTRGFTDNVEWLFSQMGWVTDSASYIEGIRSELQNIKNAFPGRSDISEIIAMIEQVLDDLANCDPDEYDRHLEELMNLLARLVEKIQNLPIVSEYIADISALFRGLADSVIGGFQSFGEDSTWVLEDTVFQIAGLREGIAAFLGTTEADIANVRESVSGVLSSLTALQSSAMDVLDGKSSGTEDISSQVSAKEKGMIVNSENSAVISGDYNIGGILGNLSAELSLDQESEALPSLDDLLFTDTTLFVRATVYACKNEGDVSARYDYAGGISGYGTRGLLLNCENSGNAKAERNYAGGAAGYFRGTVEETSSIGNISALSYAGGIAGEGKEINYCRTIPVIDSKGANCGAVAGTMDSGSENRFVNDAVGGVNGISYAGYAYPVSYEEMIEDPGSPQSFRRVVVRFVVDGEEYSKVLVAYGDPVPPYPDVPEKEDQFWSWNQPEEDTVLYSQTIGGEWKNMITTISTGGDTPEFLAEGLFTDEAKLSAEKLSGNASEEEQSYRVLVENYDGEELTVRWHMEDSGVLFAGEKEGEQILSYKRDGKYIVFPLKNGESFTFAKGEDLSFLELFWNIRFWISAAVFAAAIALLILMHVLGKKKKESPGIQGEGEDPEGSEEAEEPEILEQKEMPEISEEGEGPEYSEQKDGLDI